MNNDEREISGILESYTSAVFSKDAMAFIGLYDASVRVFDAWGVWSYEGSIAWQQAVEGWFTSLGNEKVRASFADVRTSTDHELALVSAIVTYAGVSASGELLRTMQNRITWVLRRSGHVLRIVHEHTSAPIGFNDSKAILQHESSS